MNYSPDEFTALVSAIERAGGALLPEPCQGVFTHFSKSEDKDQYRIKTCHCDGEHMFVLPYSPTDTEGKLDAADMRQRGAGFVRACATCDSIGAWPNFENVMEDDNAE